QVGSPLFDRIGRHISLTQAGLLLLPGARNILQEVTATRRALADLNGEVRGKLSIATSHHIGLHRLPPYLRQFSRQYPEVILDLHFLDSEQAYQDILQGRYDLAIVTLSQDEDARITAEPIWQDELCFVAAKNHTLAGAKSLKLAELSPYQAIMPDTSTYTTR